MAYFNKLTENRVVEGDYTNSAIISGTVYSDESMSSTVDISGFDGENRIEFFDPVNHIVAHTVKDNITLNVNGTWSWQASQSEVIYSGNWEVRLLLKKSGFRIHAIGLRGSADLLVEND